MQSTAKRNENINSLQYLEILIKRKRMIIAVTAASFVLSVGVSLLLPNTFRAAALILPPQQSDYGLMGGMLAQGGGLASLAGDMMGKTSNAEMYVGILNSEAIRDLIVDRFKLMEVYATKTRVDTYKRLENVAKIEVGKKTGIISVAVEDKNPKRAADIANAFVDELIKKLIDLNVTGASLNKSYLEERLAKVNADLVVAEDALKKFSAKNKTLQVSEQAKTAISGLARLKAELVTQEVHLSTLKSYLTDQNQEVINVKNTISGLKSEIARMEGNSPEGAILSLGSVPAISEEYGRLTREFKVQETLFELLRKQYEMAKLSETKNVSSVQIIQKASPPDKKIRPKRSQLVIIITYTTLILAILSAFVLERWERMPEEDRLLWRELKADLFRFKH